VYVPKSPTKEYCTITNRGLRAVFLPMFALWVLASAAHPAAAQGANHNGGHSSDRRWCSSTKPDIAIAACTNIIEDNSEDDDNRAIALRNRGSFYQQKGDFDRAITDYTNALKLSVGHRVQAKVHLNRGLAHFQKGDEADALTDYNEALILDPDLDSAYINRATIFMNVATMTTPSPISTKRHS
jgi:tetratricopeptide (TPR) repeat protein